jgi:hypothetical protein
MARIEHRLKKIEEHINIMPGGSTEIKVFVRTEPDDHTPEKWIEEHPEFKGKVVIVSWGSINLDPCEPSVNPSANGS